MNVCRHRRQEPLHNNHSSSEESELGNRSVRFQRMPVLYFDTDEDVEDLLLGCQRHGQRQRHQRNHGNRDFKIKIDFPQLDGHLHIKDFLDWLHTVENFFEYSEVAEEEQVKIDAYKLKGHTSAWWEQLRYNRRCEGKQHIQSWPKMRRLLKARFLPVDYEQILYQQF